MQGAVTWPFHPGSIVWLVVLSVSRGLTVGHLATIASHHAMVALSAVAAGRPVSVAITLASLAIAREIAKTYHPQ